MTIPCTNEVQHNSVFINSSKFFEANLMALSKKRYFSLLPPVLASKCHLLKKLFTMLPLTDCSKPMLVAPFPSSQSSTTFSLTGAGFALPCLVKAFMLCCKSHLSFANLRISNIRNSIQTRLGNSQPISQLRRELRKFRTNFGTFSSKVM